jgi:hypothetical protein
LTWHVAAGALVAASVAMLTCSLVLFVVWEMVGGSDHSPWPTVLALAAVALATLARWAELRFKTTLARQMLRISEDTLTLMRTLAANPSVDPDVARIRLAAAQADIDRFRASVLPNR